MTGRYYARFSTRNFELRAYEELDATAKDRIAPVVTLARTNRATTFAPVLDDVMAAAGGREVIVDFDPVPRKVTTAQEAADNRRRKAARERREAREPTDKQLAYHGFLREGAEAFNAALASLLDPRDGGRAWMGLVGSAPNAVPILQLRSEAAVIDQVALANVRGMKVAFRVSATDPGEIALAALGVSRMKVPSRAILLVEADHRRGDPDRSVRRVDSAFRLLRDTLGESFAPLTKVAVSGSFPGGSLRDHSRSLAIEELGVHASIAGTWGASYGDHSSIQPRSDQAGGNGWFPHVDLATPTHWKIDIDDTKSSAAGYVKAAARVMKTEDWTARADCWGTRMIAEGAEGRLEQDGIKLTMPAPWLAVRINQHLTRQAHARR